MADIQKEHAYQKQDGVFLNSRALLAKKTTRGVRYYKSAANSGVHTGSLWNSNGTLLATATFTAEGTSGWQQVLFSTPVAVTAGATYVASYHTNVGHFAVNRSYFTSSSLRRSQVGLSIASTSRTRSA